MASREVSLHVSRLMRDMTLSVKLRGTRVFSVRVWLAVRLLHVVARILGCGIEIETEIEQAAR